MEEGKDEHTITSTNASFSFIHSSPDPPLSLPPSLPPSLPLSRNRLEAQSRCGRRRMEVVMVAPPGSFGPPLYVPTPGGFSRLPGCRESFTATAHINAVDEGGHGAGKRIVLEETYEVPLAALELGGDLQRL